MHDNSSKMRHSRKLERKAGSKPPYARILMVCEGTDTEPNYFNEIRVHFRIPQAHWIALPSGFGTGPEKVVAFAENKAKEDGTWDEVYCIFDRDDHLHYHEAITKARSLDGKIKTKNPIAPVRFKAIPSVPSFELWFLFHFSALTREEHRDTITHLLKAEMPDYGKNRRDMFKITFPSLNLAFTRAATARQRREDTGNDNPSTDADLLVKRLFEAGPH